MAWTEGVPTLHYRVDGNGSPTLLLLHEMGGSLQSWDAVVAELPARYGVVRFDQRGFGLSEKVRAPYGPGELHEDALAVLEAAGVDQPVCIVAAAGAWAIASGLAQHFRQRVRAIVGCSPSIAPDAEARLQAQARAERVAREGMRAIADMAMLRMYPPAIRNDAFQEYRSRFLANDPVGFALANQAFACSEVDLSALDLPILLLAGEHDVRPVESVRQLASTLSAARVEVIEHAGHLMPVQAPGAVARHIESFVESLAISRAE